MDVDWLELLKDLWLFYSIGKEIYTQLNNRKEKSKRRKLR